MLLKTIPNLSDFRAPIGTRIKLDNRSKIAVISVAIRSLFLIASISSFVHMGRFAFNSNYPKQFLLQRRKRIHISRKF